jgi:callose synthase
MLSKLYGFQVDNARNQAEHLLMLLFNESQPTDRLISGAAFRLHAKFFANYKNWCVRMGAKNLLMRYVEWSRFKRHLKYYLVKFAEI